jgi:peptidoglycan L-alanyl-D-glutamate endopeptidase CwlK
MTDRSLDHLHPSLKPLCQQWLDKCKFQAINVTVIETYRSAAEQDRLFAIGREVNGTVIGMTFTKARGGQSKHNFTLNGKPASKAFDFTIINRGECNWDTNTPEWTAAVAIGKALGLVWGGDFPSKQFDADHFELRDDGSVAT